jgi:hypothetical protein
MGKDWREEFGGQGLPHEWTTMMTFFYCSITIQATTLGAVGAIFFMQLLLPLLLQPKITFITGYLGVQATVFMKP